MIDLARFYYFCNSYSKYCANYFHYSWSFIYIQGISCKRDNISVIDQRLINSILTHNSCYCLCHTQRAIFIGNSIGYYFDIFRVVVDYYFPIHGELTSFLLVFYYPMVCGLSLCSSRDPCVWCVSTLPAAATTRCGLRLGAGKARSHACAHCSKSSARCWLYVSLPKSRLLLQRLALFLEGN